MTINERLAAVVGALTIVSAFVYAGMEFGRQQERIAVLTQDITSLRAELSGVNKLMIEWTIRHRRED